MRSMLFAGATRPDLVAKMDRSGTDIAVIDLEDAVPPAAKNEARDNLPTLATTVTAASLFIRVNGAATEWFEDDLRAVAVLPCEGVVLPEVSAPEEVRRASEVVAGKRVLAGIETAIGVSRCEEILGDGSAALAYFGADDYVADLGGRRTAAGHEALYARSRVVLAARLARATIFDQIVADFRDDERFRVDAAAGRDLGYHGKMCVHPAQVTIANEVFGGSDQELIRAKAMLAAWSEAADRGVAAIDFEGQMVDGPALKMAEEIVARAEGEI